MIFFLALAALSAICVAAPVPEYQPAASEYGGRQVIILDNSNGYGNDLSYKSSDNGYGGYGYDPIVVYIPNSYPYYSEHMPYYGNYYGPPAHSPHYEEGSYGKY